MTKHVAYLGVAVAAALSAFVVGLPAASAASFASLLQTPSGGTPVQLVGGDRDYVDDYDDGRDTHVRAPFTSVDTSNNKRKGTQVQAPFTSVDSYDGGTRIRAPFVDLFVPRR